MDASQRIVFLQEKLRDLRQAYSALKTQLVLIDRRRKKLKRKEKDPTFWTHPINPSPPPLRCYFNLILTSDFKKCYLFLKLI